ncbi:SPOSA6832_00310 [Sporobolomyces salmonicolor]|uniref:Dipeptidase n=1 Tax=Sporidiobolus salmonicolor TaxID=5005 RepID=A0A0D6EFP7_SPOSA|nr:SPOSA6832_00310 [Sporobolomyces salmonicolor]
MKGLQDSTEPEQRFQSRPPPRGRAPSFRRFFTVVVLAAACLAFSSPATTLELVGDGWIAFQHAVIPLPTDPHERALALLARQPIIAKDSAGSHPFLRQIDGHVDLPVITRFMYRNQIGDIDMNSTIKGHVDIPRLRAGRVGGFFWSVFVPCPEDAGYPKDNDGNFTTPTHRTFEFTPTASAWRRAMKHGKIGGMLGVEGGHQLGSSLASIRAYYALGARYVTLTHTCHNALADSCGMQDVPIAPRWGGLSAFGLTAIQEMNRLGMLIDVSHTAPETASAALTHSEAPVIFSHSNARGVHGAVRNVPDAILRRIGAIDPSRRQFNLSEDGEKGLGWGAESGEAEKKVKGGDSLVMLNFSPLFVSEWPNGTGVRANVSLVAGEFRSLLPPPGPSLAFESTSLAAVPLLRPHLRRLPGSLPPPADHADYIGRLAGREHIGIGADFDGIPTTPEGLEDVSAYPRLIAELIRRGWTDKEILGVAGVWRLTPLVAIGNLLRILDKVEATSRRLRHLPPSTAIFEGRDDLNKRDGF